MSAHVALRTYYLEHFFVWEYERYCRSYWQCYGLKASKLVSLAYPPQYGKLSSSEIRENEVKEATLPPVQIRHTGSLITDLEPIDKPQILPDQPDQTKIEKTRSDFPKGLSFPPFEKTRSVSQQPWANFRPGPEL